MKKQLYYLSSRPFDPFETRKMLKEELGVGNKGLRRALKTHRAVIWFWMGAHPNIPFRRVSEGVDVFRHRERHEFWTKYGI